VPGWSSQALKIHHRTGSPRLAKFALTTLGSTVEKVHGNPKANIMSFRMACFCGVAYRAEDFPEVNTGEHTSTTLAMQL